MKREIDSRAESKQTLHWELLEPPQCSVLHMNMVRVLAKSNHFAQVSLRFKSSQVC